MTEGPDYRTKYHEALSLLAETKAMLGNCIGMLRMTAQDLEEVGWNSVPEIIREQADKAEVIRWKELP